MNVDMSDYECLIEGELKEDNGLKVDMGIVLTAWFDIPLPPCPDCGAGLAEAEAGHVPGSRKCQGCGSFFSVEVENGRAHLRRDRFYRTEF